MYKQEGYRLMRAAFNVYNEIGYGMAEEIYQESLEIERGLLGIPFQSKPKLLVFFKTKELTTKYQPDLVVFENLLIELKAVSQLISDHEAQLFNYMRIARQPVGYLLNFGRNGGLEWRRFILDDLHEKTETDEKDKEH